MNAVNRFSQSVVCLVVIIMLAISVGVVYDRGRLEAQTRPGLCGPEFSGSVCMELEVCFFGWCVWTETWRYPEAPPPSWWPPA